MGTRPATADSDLVTAAPNTRDLRVDFDSKKSLDNTTIEVEKATPAGEEQNSLEHVRTTASTVDKSPTTNSELDDEDDDDHIHTAVPPELLTNPGDSCAICIDTLEEDDDIRGLTCGHAFHAGCLDPWLTSRRACCPLCMQITTYPNLDLRARLQRQIDLVEEGIVCHNHPLLLGLVFEVALVLC